MLIPVPFATHSDLAARWRTLTVAEQAQATVLLGDASNLILSECPSANFVADDDTAEQATRAATLKRIVCAMVKRAMIGGGEMAGVSQQQQTAGPFSQNQSYANPMGDIYLTKAEKRSLPCGRQMAFTIPMVNDADYSPWAV